MDELRGPTIQIVLHLQEGLGFGFLRSPFVVSGSLNGYMLETDPVVPGHAPVFDAELVWEADKRRFRSLRIQNVPIKVEVFTLGSLGRKDKVGYLLISLLAAQPKPYNKIVDIKHSWHRLLGVKSEGKCCHPQLLMSLSVEDRAHTPTPRNELRLFHSNEMAFPSAAPQEPHERVMMLSVKEYLAESTRTVTSPDLQPRLLCDEGLIQLGAGRQLFVLSLVVGAVDGLDLLLPNPVTSPKDVNCFVSYSVFTHNISTDRVSATVTGEGVAAVFNQRSSLRLRASLAALGQYFAECPHLVTRVCADTGTDIGICSLDLRKLIPTHDIDHFLRHHCNYEDALTIHERCFLLRCEGEAREGARRPYLDVEMTLKYVGYSEENSAKPVQLTARSAAQLGAGGSQPALHCRAGSCTQLRQDMPGSHHTNMAVSSTARFKNASGDLVVQTNEITDLIKKMYDSFTLSQEKLLSRLHPATSDMQVQCEPQGIGDGPGTRDPEVKETTPGTRTKVDRDIVKESSMEHGKGNKCEHGGNVNSHDLRDSITMKETSKSDTYVHYPPQHYNVPYNVLNQTDMVKLAISPEEREAIMKNFVEELEDWKERQQELYKCNLKRKEEYHLELLAKEWNKKREELETKLHGGIEQCRHLAADLSRATDEFRLKGFRNTQREKKLLDAKKALEAHYTAKYQELREASRQMEDDMNHRLKLKDMRIEELETRVVQLEKQVEDLKENIKSRVRDAENKYSGLTKDQTASLIQELRHLEEKLDSAMQSKAFFKEQWGRAVRELHVMKISSRRQMLSQLQQNRQQLGLGKGGLQTTIEEPMETKSEEDLKKLKDNFYVELLVDSPALEVESYTTVSEGPTGMYIFDDVKSPKKDKLSELISQRDNLMQQDSPDEDLMKQLNHEIRAMLLNCGT